MSQAEDRTFDLHCARVYLAQSRHLRQIHRAFSFMLFDWAAEATRRMLNRRQNTRREAQS